jgi:DNA (cytosine-5)-methyltransferase 1
MVTIKLLDLCCKAGGCSMGYFLASQDLGLSIEITGIDIEPQPNYPFNFIQADAVEYLKENGNKFTHIHASPPCQKYSRSTAPHRKNHEYSDLLIIIKPLLYKLGLPAVLENVMLSPLRPDIILRGDMFGLKTLRSRKFELVNWFMLQPGKQKIKPGSVVHFGEYITCTGHGQLGSMNKKKEYVKFKYALNNVLTTWSMAMGINWMNTDELREAIPPPYTHYIGLNFFRWPQT